MGGVGDSGNPHRSTTPLLSETSGCLVTSQLALSPIQVVLPPHNLIHPQGMSGAAAKEQTGGKKKKTKKRSTCAHDEE